jgi:hypothetical protein
MSSLVSLLLPSGDFSAEAVGMINPPIQALAL